MTGQTDAAESAATISNRQGSSPIALVCEHASSYIPPAYGQLGLDSEQLNSHIAFDLGARRLTEDLCAKLDAVAVLGSVSRLVYDCNRPPEATDAMPAHSEVHDIPGNDSLSSDARSKRIQTVYDPFHAAVAQVLDAHAQLAALVSVHSFTPVYKGNKRSVRVGFLHDEDDRLAHALMDAAGNEPLLKDAALNQPYSKSDGVTHTLQRHGTDRGIANVMIEVRNDLLASAQASNDMAAALASCLQASLASLKLK